MRRALLICAVLVFLCSSKDAADDVRCSDLSGFASHYMCAPPDSAGSVSKGFVRFLEQHRDQSRARLWRPARSAGSETSREASIPRDRFLWSGNGLNMRRNTYLKNYHNVARDAPGSGRISHAASSQSQPSQKSEQHRTSRRTPRVYSNRVATARQEPCARIVQTCLECRPAPRSRSIL